MRIEDLQGRRIGRYEITGLLGRGGMAAVYRARDTALQRDIALKILYPQYLHDEDQIARFKREAVVAAGLDHPNIVQIYDVGEDQGLVYIAMQLLLGRPLSDVLRERGRISPHELAPMVDQIASALDYAHARGIIHRDIKPANIILDAEGRTVLTDFGIAKMLDAPGFTSTSVMIGTPDYMAPEQIGSQPIDGRVDIYALGVLVFRALTGRRPYEGGTDEVLLGHLNGMPPAASTLVPGLPSDIDAVIRTAMGRRPDDRYRHASDLAAELRDAAGLPPSMSQQRRRPMPAVPVVPATLAADAPTARGNVYPVSVNPIDAGTHAAPAEGYNPATIGRTTQPETRRGNPLLPIVVALLLLIVGGGGFLLANQLLAGGSGGNGAASTPTDSVGVLVPITDVPAFTPAPTAYVTVIATTTQAPTAPVTALPAEPTAPPATIAPTSVLATPTRTPRTPTASTTTAPSNTPTATPSPTITPTETATPSPTSALAACQIQPVRGFATLLQNNTVLQNRLGCPTGEEVGGILAQQAFERGTMFWFSYDTGENFYVLSGDTTENNQGIWESFTTAEVNSFKGQEPPDVGTPGNGLYTPRFDSGFYYIWTFNEKVRDNLGFARSVNETENSNAALQQFEKGVMLFSPKDFGGGPFIYVLLNEASFERFPDESPTAPN